MSRNEALVTLLFMEPPRAPASPTRGRGGELGSKPSTWQAFPLLCAARKAGGSTPPPRVREEVNGC
jgi:hypothetical protein